MKKFRVIILGAGNRGNRYAAHFAEHPDQYEIVAMADPLKARREQFQKAYGVPAEHCYDSWEDALSLPKMADICVIATHDDQHYYPALKAIDLGYDLLLEKPIAQTAKECADIARAADRKGVRVLVCHVLRYTPFYGKVKQLIMSNTIGEVISIEAAECVSNTHFAHAYVRGRWCREENATPLLLAKCSHDLDIIQWLLDKPCTRVQSFGSLTHFTPKNAPQNAPIRCATESCPVRATCPYDCLQEYIANKKNVRRSRITLGYSKHYEPTDEEVMEALRHEDFGLCVYHANNDVVDHQIVNMEFDGGAVASLCVNAFNKGGRYIHIHGTTGELTGYMKENSVDVYTFADKTCRTVPVLEEGQTIYGGHGGGDSGIVTELYAYLSGTYTGYRAADIRISTQNHMIGFAAEESRHHHTVTDMEEFCRQNGF